MDKPLNSTLALSQLNRDSPNDLICKDLGITTIGNLADVPAIRNLELSYNPITSLSGIDQFPQLRQLTAYGCRLKDIDGLAGVKKLERLHLQQNSIKRIGDAFKHLTKLRDVRLDRNRLSGIENLGGCGGLRVLDLSYNQITSVEGLAGLQSLVELKINNNAVKSLRPLKGLPSLREIDCSYNSLKSLDGIQFLPVLEVVHAEHNQVYTLQLGGDKEAARGDKALSRSASAEGQAASVQANRLSEMTSALKQSRKGSSSSLGGAANQGKTVKAKAAEEKQLGIVELHLRGNRLKSLEHLGPLGPLIEVLDVSSNDIAADGAALARQLAHLHKLGEIRIEGNPALMALCTAEDDSQYVELQSSLVSACPSLRHVDTSAVVGGRVVSAAGSDEASLRLIQSIETALHIDNDQDSLGSASASSRPVLNADGTISHTWQSRGGEGSTVLGDEASLANGAQSGSSDEEDAQEKAEEAAQKAQTAGLSVDESMLSEDQIAQIEASFTGLLAECRDRLNALPRPPTKGEDGEEDLAVGQLSSVYTDLGGRSLNAQPIVTESGRRTSRNLAAQGGGARALLSPPMPPRPQNAVVQSVGRQIELESSALVSPGPPGRGGEKAVLTTSSSLVTNVIMYASAADKDKDKGPGGGPLRSNSLKDMNVDAFSRKEGIEDI